MVRERSLPPDKAIDLIDEAGSRVRIQRATAPNSLKEAMRELDSVIKDKEGAIEGQNYERAAALRDSESKVREKIQRLESGFHKQDDIARPKVTEEDVAQIVSMWTGIPVTRIAQEESSASCTWRKTSTSTLSSARTRPSRP